MEGDRPEMSVVISLHDSKNSEQMQIWGGEGYSGGNRFATFETLSKAKFNCEKELIKKKAYPLEDTPKHRSKDILSIYSGKWWAMRDSNSRHLRCKRSALPTELIAH